MNKTISMLLAIVLLLSCFINVAMADDFVIHSGTTFGMNKEKVIELEKRAGFILTSEDGITNVKNVVRIKGKVAVYPDAIIEYIFNQNDTLVSVYYTLTIGEKKGYTKELFSDLLTLLSTKYGEPDSTAKVAIQEKFLPSSLRCNMLLQFPNNSIIDSCAFIGKEDDEKFVIIFPFIASADATVAVSLNSSKPVHYEGMFILYQQFSKDEYYNAIQSMTEDVVSILDDL